MDGGCLFAEKALGCSQGEWSRREGPWLLVLLRVAERGRGKTKVRGRSREPWRPPAGPHLSHPSECWEYPPLLLTNKHSMTR